MKWKYFVTVCLCVSTVLPMTAWAQQRVGINTMEPRTTLEVAGSVEITESLKIGQIDAVSDTDKSTFLVQTASNNIKSLDVSNPVAEALGYIQEYVIFNPFQDFVRDFDTGINATDYVLVAITANYDEELALFNASGQSDNFSLPFTSTFISGGTWHIVANYPVARNSDTAAQGTWTITTLIFSKDLSKQFGTTVIDMSGTSSGNAITPIID